MATPRRDRFAIGGKEIAAGQRGTVELPISRLVTGSPLSLPVLVLHGRSEGPTVWVNAAVHGDEVNGVEIIRRVLEDLKPRELRGTLLAIPVVNGPGFIAGDRYLPDRRDLNRSFPGAAKGSLASRIAHIFVREIVARSTVGIDLHTGSDHRTNLPQIRADLDNPATLKLARAFGAPVMLHAATRDGSLRQSAADQGATVLLYEGGEAWRFDKSAIAVGVRGVRRVLEELDMVDPADGGHHTLPDPILCRKSRWVRVRRSGMVQLWVGVGDVVSKGQPVGQIHDAFGKRLSRVNATVGGVVIGLNLQPIVNQGDAVMNIAQPESEPT